MSTPCPQLNSPLSLPACVSAECLVDRRPPSLNSPTPRVPSCGIFPRGRPTSCPSNREAAGSAPPCDGAMDSSGQDIVGWACDWAGPSLPCHQLACWYGPGLPLGVVTFPWAVTTPFLPRGHVQSSSPSSLVSLPLVLTLGCILDKYHVPVAVMSETSLLQVYSKLAISLSRYLGQHQDHHDS